MSESESATSGDDRTADSEPSGNHTEGVTVADLIAKLAEGSAPSPARRRRRHRAEPEPAEPEPAEPEPAEPAQTDKPAEKVQEEPARTSNSAPAPETDQPQTDPIEALAAAYADELPDLEAIAAERAKAPDLVPTSAALVPFRPRELAIPEPPKKPKRFRRPILLLGRSAAALIALTALLLTGTAWQWQSTKNKLLNHVAALDLDSRDIVDPNAQFGDENYLIVGVDSRVGANGQMGAGSTEDADGARSDTVMLVNIPANRKRVVAVSFPRDLAITPMKCQAWDPETGKYGPVRDKQTGEYSPDQRYTETKLNSAYSFGGPKCLVKVIQKLSGLSINRFMAIDFAGFSKMVDALGGVEVCSPTPLKDYELGTVLDHAGRQTLDGHTALNYVRARQVTTEVNGDYGRIKRQQLFLSSMLRSMISSDTLFSLSKLNTVVNMFIADTYVDNVKTKDLVDLGQSLQGVSAGRITFVTVPTTGITDADGNEEPRTQDIRALFDAIINDDPLPGENDQNEITSAPTTSDNSALAAAKSDPPAVEAQTVNAVTVAPSDVTVQVSNSTAKNGVASTATTEFKQQGFTVMSPDDYADGVNTTTVMFSGGNESAAATVAAALKSTNNKRVNGLGSVVQVVLGTDFQSVSAPPASGSSVTVNVSHGDKNATTDLPADLTVTNAADTTCD
jgi:LCP family protein required for cell wall assembly